MHACLGFPGGSVVKNPPANAGDTGSVLGSGRGGRLGPDHRSARLTESGNAKVEGSESPGFRPYLGE